MNFKKIILYVLNTVLAVYLVLAVTSFNKPDEARQVCNKVTINVSDATTGGFIDTKEVRKRLTANGLYPLNKRMVDISARRIEESLLHTPFIRTANCTKTIGGTVYITITQRTPVIRVMAANGDDYYLDDQNSIMRGRSYTSDLIVATGAISRTMATRQLSAVGQAILQNEQWRSLIEQVNVLPGGSIEIVPRVGNHIVCLGQLPDSKNDELRNELIKTFIDKKLARLMKFYRYGLSEAGWNRYDYISIEFDNQIICHKDPAFERQHNPSQPSTAMPTSTPETAPTVVPTEAQGEKKETQSEKKEVPQTTKPSTSTKPKNSTAQATKRITA